MLTFRLANYNDAELFFRWANDSSARENSYQKAPISYNDHITWFKKKMSFCAESFYIFQNMEGIPIGQVRIETSGAKEATISISIDINYRKQGYAVEMIIKASESFLLKHKDFEIHAYILKTNESSYHCFLKAGFKFLKEEIIKNIPSYILYKA